MCDASVYKCGCMPRERGREREKDGTKERERQKDKGIETNRKGDKEKERKGEGRKEREDCEVRTKAEDYSLLKIIMACPIISWFYKIMSYNKLVL